MQSNPSNSYFEIKPEMKPDDYYLRLINNLETANKDVDRLVPEARAALIELGAFLYSRSTEFEMLQNQDNAHKPNLLHIFQYYFSGNAMVNNRKDSAGKELIVMLDQINDLLHSNM